MIAFPLERLPPIDEHGTLILAPVHRVWEALLEIAPRSFSGPASERIARALGCAQTPGLKGRVYKAVVIGSRAHVLVVNRILGAIRRRAED
jgi:hypothetical protein